MKNSKIAKICHLIFLIVIALFCLNSAIVAFFNIGLSSAIYADTPRPAMVLFGIINVVNIVALCLSIIYVIKDYGKNVAWVYKAFLLTLIASTITEIVTNFVANSSGKLYHSLVLILILMAIQILLLVILVIGKDLGSKFTWFIFFAFLVIDIARLIIIGLNAGFVLIWVVLLVTRMVLCGTISIAIFGKYKDKKLRGAE